MAAITFHNSFKENLAEKAISLGADQLVYALTPAANAPLASNSLLADLTQIAYTNLSTRNVTTSSSAMSGSTYQLVLADLVLTASGGAVAAFRYLDLYSDTSTGDMLIGFYDYGSALTLANTETLTIDHASPSLTLA